ncbi:MAG: glycosyltransferase family 39 protein [Chloroflexi bacterium]|nr:glycosyltransferase family 39 protein [Chloroflexota bacterium]
MTGFEKPMMDAPGSTMATIGERRPRSEPPASVLASHSILDGRATFLACTVVCGAAAAIIALISFAELALPLSTDQALYSFIGRAIHHGAVPYRDFTDLKPPGIFYVRAILDALAPVSWTGACFSGSIQPSCGWLVVKLADLATTLLFALTLYATARSMQFDRAAAVLAGALGAVYVSLSYISQMGLTPEKLAAMCTLGAVLFAARRRWLLAGMAVGLAVLMKQPAATALLPVCVFAVNTRRRLPAMLQVLVGLAAPLLLVALVLQAQAALQAAISYVVMINFERIGTPARLGGFGGDGSIQTAWQAFRDGLAPFWLLGGAGALASTALPPRWRWPLLAWFVVDALLLLRLREFIQLGPSIALLGAWAATRIWRAAGQPPYAGLSTSIAARCVLVGVFASLVALSSSYQLSIVMRAINERTQRNFVRSPDEFVADALARVPPGPLFVWGNGAELYLLTDRAPASTTLNVIPLSSNLPGAQSRRAALIQQLQTTRPVAIVVSPEVDRPDNGISLRDFPQLNTLLQQDYAPVDDLVRDRKYGGWQLYVLRTA